jgi:hypothetical protein
MTARAPRLTYSLDPLIAEAKRRMRRRRTLVLALLFVAVAVGVAFALRSPGGPGSNGSPAAGGTVQLSSHGIGGVHVGATKAQTVAELSRLFGPPSRRFVSDACGPTYSEVAWGHLYVEFRHERFSGYRYLGGAWLRSGVTPGHNSGRVRPPLAIGRGITIGDTLRQLRRAVGRLSPVGTSRWSSQGLLFYVNSQSYPDPPGSRIIEIKSATTCGDF